MRSIAVPILMYHALDERRSPISVSPALFKWQMRWLHEHNYHVISLRTLIHHMQNELSLPSCSVVITFDDGFASVYTHAFPTLAEYNFPATVFVIGGYIGGYNDWPGQPSFIPRYPLLNWSQIREMAQYNIEFGAHTVSHPRLDRVTPDKLVHEIITGKAIIENQLGYSVEVFAYPYGCYNHHTKALVSQLYAGACSTHLGMVNLNSDIFALERVEVLYLTQSYLFQWMSVPSLFSVYLTVRKFLRLTATALLRWK